MVQKTSEHVLDSFEGANVLFLVRVPDRGSILKHRKYVGSVGMDKRRAIGTLEGAEKTEDQSYAFFINIGAVFIESEIRIDKNTEITNRVYHGQNMTVERIRHARIIFAKVHNNTFSGGKFKL